MKTHWIIGLFLMAIVGCQPENSLQTITVSDQFRLTIPSFLKKTDALNDQAALQYMSAFREFYVIVIVDNKIEVQNQLILNGLEEEYSIDLDGFAKLSIHYSAENIFHTENITFDTVVINNLNAYAFRLNTFSQDHPVYFHCALIEGKNRFYQLFTWTLTEKESIHKNQMNDIINSFNEI